MAWSGRHPWARWVTRAVLLCCATALLLLLAHLLGWLSRAQIDFLAN